MIKSNLFSFLSVASLSLSFALQAGATTIPANTITVGPSAPAGAVTTTFGATLSATTPGIWTGTTGSGTANKSVTNSYTDPLNGPGYFAYAEAGSTITASFAGGITSLDLLWGSPDNYNTITFNGPSGSVSYSPGSGALTSLTATQAGNALVLFTAAPGTDWTSVNFSSSQNSFEFAQVATVGAASPEPASLALIAGGLIALGVFRRRQNA